MKKCLLLLALVSVGAFAATNMPGKGLSNNYWSSPNPNTPWVIQVFAAQDVNIGIYVVSTNQTGQPTDGANILCNGTKIFVSAPGYLVCQTNQNITITDAGNNPAGAMGYFSDPTKKKQ